MNWSIKELDAPQLADWLDTGSEVFRVIDVREMREIAHGTVPNAEPVPLATLPVRLNEMGRDETIVFICRSGARSAQACMFMQQQGYDKVYNLRGGMISWAGSNLPIGAAG
jgi:rhodanese-related sulfurtransferase